ncbi:sterol-binding-like protein [Hesseltinella vesiculosa]|uniref:Sterol-binding-like protein n=1 Tax=Hesseltinella vesiculosa TaxID=101127 RepID=A0A1X2GUH8_9FUNG|nr:sterol-binding-like protein [Hesseltinella vesiculosa]
MSDIIVPGFKSSELIHQLNVVFTAFTEDERQNLVKQVNGVFQFVIINDKKQQEVFTIDCKKNGTVLRGKGDIKADTILNIADQDFIDLAEGRLNGQKAYMSGKLKVKGQIMLAMKLDNVFKSIKQDKAKL